MRYVIVAAGPAHQEEGGRAAQATSTRDHHLALSNTTDEGGEAALIPGEDHLITLVAAQNLSRSEG